CVWLWETVERCTEYNLRRTHTQGIRGDARGFLIATAMDQRAVVPVRFVLADFRVQAKENEAAGNLAATLALRASVARRVLSLVPAGGPLSMAGCALCSGWRSPWLGGRASAGRRGGHRGSG